MSNKQNVPNLISGLKHTQSGTAVPQGNISGGQTVLNNNLPNNYQQSGFQQRTVGNQVLHHPQHTVPQQMVNPQQGAAVANVSQDTISNFGQTIQKRYA